jgi:tetratricopeptide (TPR) repeat protein
VKQALQSVVLFRVDAEKGEGIELAKAHAVRAYPTFELMGADAATIDRWVGYSKAMFLATLPEALKDPAPLEAKRARFERAPAAADAAALGRYHSSRYELADAVRYFRDAQRLNRDPAQDYTENIFENIARGVPDTTFTLLDLKEAADAVLAAAGQSPERLLTLGATTLAIGLGQGDPSFAAPYVKAAIDATAGATDSQTQQLRKELLAEQALNITHEPERAVALKRETMSAGWTERASDLNSFAWWCFEGRTNLPEAEELARKALGLAAAGKEKAMILDTLAEIVNARGNPQEAVTLIQQAVQEAPGEKYYPRQLARFQKLAAGPA